ncbi:D-hydantoinase [Rathayibacter tanaceti]|uniref:D-hydantoinase n=1 Tax=Rathayibacter tanaceti TaxID=1671680 RepID=A0A162GR92_9MICO|nr:D-hydantoinase [Rathayibacter tanaceti]
MKTLITGGTVVNATGTGSADVLIDGETIAAVLAPGSTLLGFDLAANVDRVIDATGKYVIPGGIDAHTHMEMPFGGTFASDTFETGTRAAAWGGTTSIVDFVVQYPGESVLDRYQPGRRRRRGTARSTTASTRSCPTCRTRRSSRWTS